MTGLRERKKADTRRALSDAALQLAFERGLDNVTREDVANLAGVSIRTFNNYFAGKYEALAYRQTERMRRGIELFRQRPADEPLWTAITHAVLQPVEEDYDDAFGTADHPPSRHELVEVRKLLLKPQIRQAVPGNLLNDWIDAVAQRTGTDPERDLYPRLVVSVIRAVGDAAAEAYVRADPPVPFTTLFRDGIAAVSAGMQEPSRKKTP
ncbi:MAG TPA: TetR/AcrR family transcriptional regulator [Mycobacterium sp.]